MRSRFPFILPYINISFSTVTYLSQLMYCSLFSFSVFADVSRDVSRFLNSLHIQVVILLAHTEILKAFRYILILSMISILQICRYENHFPVL